MTSTVLKNNIDTQITNQTAQNSVSPAIEGTQMKSIVDYVDQEIQTVSDAIDSLTPPAPIFKKYVALISQNGTNNPTVVVLENELSAPIVWTRAFANS